MEANMPRAHHTSENGAHKAKSIMGAHKLPHRTKHKVSHSDANTYASQTVSDLDNDLRQSMIETTAYFLAERRQFEPGHELEDWCAAEASVDDRLGLSFNLMRDEPDAR
jgi:hypothetical protein